MKVKIEDIPATILKLPFENRGIVVTSETEEEKQYLERMWTRSAAAVMLARHDNGTVTLTFGPTKPEGI